MSDPKTYTFTITISGYGENVDQAWDDAVNSMAIDPGPPPDDYEEE